MVSGQSIAVVPGMAVSQIWGADEPLHYPDNGAKPRYANLLPPLNGCRLLEFELPAGMGLLTAAQNAAAGANEGPFKSAEIARMLSSDRPGMHRTATLDMIIVLQGACVLGLDEGEVTLRTGDVLIESGTMHAWRNPFEDPCRLLAAIVGARNELCD